MKLTFTLIALCSYCLLNAQKAGTLDSSFGVDGKVITPANGLLNKIALQSDGKIIGAGAGNFDSQPPFLIIRYNHNGSIDSSFGNSGISGIGVQLSDVLSLAILPDDAIIALGRVSAYVNITKFKKDGTVDSSFGNDGTVITIAGAFDMPTDVVIQTDNKIVVGGYIINEPNENRQLLLIRYMPDGSLDNSFGNNGIVILGAVSGGELPAFYSLNALALQPNGQILASVYLTKGAVYRFNTDGSQDKTFGNNGTAYFQTKDNSVVNFQAYGLVVQPDGRIIGGGSSTKAGGNPLHYMAAARLNSNGTIDSTFGNSGLQHVLFGNNPSEGTGILLQKDGKLIVTGRTHPENESSSNLALIRFSPFGILDSSFGNNGQAITEVGNIAVGNSSLLQKNGQILLGGYSDTLGSSFVVARYNNDDKTKRQIIIQKIKHYIATHNDAQATTLNNVSIYPNPAQNILHVEGLAANAKLTVVDFNGNVIVSRELSPVPSNTGVVSNGYDLNVSSLHAGNYLLKIETNGEVVTRQFVKE